MTSQKLNIIIILRRQVIISILISTLYTNNSLETEKTHDYSKEYLETCKCLTCN